MAVMCRLLGVSRAGFYAWERRAPSDRTLKDVWLLEKIREIHTLSDGTYGARRVHAELRLGEASSEHFRILRPGVSGELTQIPAYH